MQNLFSFLLQYIGLSLAFVAILIAIIILEMKEQTGGPERLSAEQAVELINHHEAVVIDIRDKQAFAQGHIINAINISKDELEKSDAKLGQYKSKPIILVCQAGITAKPVVEQLRKKGYVEAKALIGGLNAWRAANLPLEK